MNPIASILNYQPVLVIDGALATELEKRGYNLKDKLWSAKILLEQPEAIKQLHYDYFKAGADCVITASYQATIEGFMKRGLTEERYEPRFPINKSQAILFRLLPLRPCPS